MVYLSKLKNKYFSVLSGGIEQVSKGINQSWTISKFYLYLTFEVFLAI